MRTPTTLALVVLIATLVVCAGSPTHAAPIPKHLMREPDNQTKLQGRWKVQTIKIGERDLYAGRGLSYEMIYDFQEHQLTMTTISAGTARSTVRAIQPDGKSDKQFHATNVPVVPANGAVQPAAIRQIKYVYHYGFDGDTLLISFHSATVDKKVDPLKPGPNDLVYVLVREK